MNWFEQLTGFAESTPSQVRSNLRIEGENLRSLVNDKVYHFGKLATPTLAQVRKRAPNLDSLTGKISVLEVVGNVQYFHLMPENAGATFQAASQFNLLEMVSPNVSPEQGIGIYEHDRTQGPACAIACGAGTIYRNYFAQIGEQIGQTEDQQIDCLKDIGAALNNEELSLWDMKNGYALATEDGLKHITQVLESGTTDEYEQLKSKLRIGVQWDTEVTLQNTQHHVTQVYCSALPVAYSRLDAELWEAFARLVLEASYEATFYTALINAELTRNYQLYLTLLGGGAFGNPDQWINDAIVKTVKKFARTPLQVKIVSYGAPSPVVKSILENL